MAPHIRSSTHDPIDDSELQKLLTRVYRDGGFTDSERAAAIFDPSAVRARGEILHVDGHDGQLLGMVIVVPPTSSARRFARSGECEMHLLATSPEARRSGIGRALVKAAIAKARSEGYSRMLLWTQASMHAAQRLYESCGFSRVPSRDFKDSGREFLFFEASLV